MLALQVFSPAPGWAANPAPNLIFNGSFASGVAPWEIEASDGSPGRVGDGGCPDPHCLQLNAPPAGRASISQAIVGLEPGIGYRIEARVHASKHQRVRLNLHDTSWKGVQCAHKPLSLFVEAEGVNDWQSLHMAVVIPAADPCGSTRDHRWRLQIEIESSRGARPGVLIDDVKVSRVEDAPSESTQGMRLLCSYFRDIQNLDPCPDGIAMGVEASREAELRTVAKWMLDEGAGALIHDYMAGRNGVFEFATAAQRPEWRAGAAFFPGGRSGSRVRIDSGQPIAGGTFEISLEISPEPDFDTGCLLVSQPPGGKLGGFRLCVSQTCVVAR